MRRLRALLGLSVLGAVVGSGCSPTPPTADDDPPRNIVVVSLDALSAKHVGTYGYERATTPALDALAAEGTVFERTWSQQLWTLTSHISMMTGLYPETHGASARGPARAGATTLAEMLREQGFETAAFTGAGGYMKPDFGLGRGFDRYAVNGSIGNAPGALHPWLRREARALAEDPERRLFLFVHYYDIHSDIGTAVPYAAPERYRREFLPDGIDWRRRGDTKLLGELRSADDIDARDLEVLRDLYDAEVLHCDQERLAPLIEMIDELGLGDETLLVVTSDHGEELLEHGGTTHGQPYDEGARVPLVLRGPGIPVGERVDAWAELVDLMPTVLDVLGLAIPAHVQGESLIPLIRGDAPRTPGAHVDGRMPGLISNYASAIARDIDGIPWTYLARVSRRNPERLNPGEPGFDLHGGPASGELYQLDQDPEQLHNRADDEPELAAELGRELVAWHEASHAAGRRLGDGKAPSDAEPLLSEEERDRLRSLGYAQ